MKSTLTFLFIALFIINAKAQIYNGEKSKLSFFSATALENIDAINTTVKTIFNSNTATFAAIARHTEFKFKSSFMQEHYNENYMESEKFPLATFSGKVNEVIDYTKDGTHQVTMTGKLKMHDVELPRTISGTIIVANGVITMDSKFDVVVADHKIKVPSLYVAKIAEVINVTFHTEMTPKKTN